MKNKRFTKMLVRNLILMAIPLALIISAAFLSVSHMRKMDDAKVYDMEDIGAAEEFYTLGKVNVRLRISDLVYSGFDYISKDKKLGSYFYSFNNGRISLYLLDNDMSERVREAAEGTAFTVKFRIVKDELTAGYIVSEYAETLGLMEHTDGEASSIYVLDQLRFPEMWIRILKIVYYALIASLIMLGLYILIAFYRPQILKQARELKRFGNVKSVVADLDYEMKNKLLYQSDNIFVTDSYLIVAYVSRIDVVYLDDVKYMSKHEELKKNRLFGGKKKTYRLTLSNVEKMYFEMFIDDEQTIDDVAYYIQGEEEEKIYETDSRDEDEVSEEYDEASEDYDDSFDDLPEAYEASDEDGFPADYSYSEDGFPEEYDAGEDGWV